MSLLLNETITIKREGAGGDYVDGYYVAGPISSTTERANIQPLGGSDLIQLAESDRLREPVRMYTAIELIENDLITRSLDGRIYEIQKKGNWAVFGRLRHYKTIGLLKDAQ